MTSDLIHGRGTKEFQDFFTPPPVAKRIADEYLRPLFRAHKVAHPERAFRLLEPAVGSGNLLWWALQVAYEEGVELDVVVFDLQQDYLDHVEATYRKFMAWRESQKRC